MTGNQCCSMSQGGQWVWEVIGSYCCGEKGHVSGEELSSANEHQQQTKRQTVKPCNMASRLMSSSTKQQLSKDIPCKPAVWHHSLCHQDTAVAKEKADHSSLQSSFIANIISTLTRESSFTRTGRPSSIHQADFLVQQNKVNKG